MPKPLLRALERQVFNDEEALEYLANSFCVLLASRATLFANSFWVVGNMAMLLLTLNPHVAEIRSMAEVDFKGFYTRRYLTK